MATERVTIEVKDLLPLTKAAEYLGVSRMTLSRWEHEGKITSVMLGHRFFHISELDRVKVAKNMLYKDIMSLAKAAEYLGVSSWTLTQWVHKGKITPVMLEHRFFHINELDRAKAAKQDIMYLTKAAEYLGVSRMTLWRWTREGKITPVSLVHNYYPISELDRVKALRNAAKKNG